VVLAIACALAAVSPAAADGPGVGTAAVVTLGDSAISGEAGRWAGNTNGDSSRTDALGSTAYWDTSTGESIPRCHRSKAAQAFIGDGVLGYNLACSGAKTTTGGTRVGRGLQARHRLLQRRPGPQGPGARAAAARRTRNVKTVVVMIGANNYGFAAIVQRSRDELPDVAFVVEELLLRRQRHDVALHLDADRHRDGERPQRAAARARRDGERGLQPLAVHDPRPDVLVSDPARFRHPLLRERLHAPVHRRRGVWNRDADWANDTVVAALKTTTINAATQTGLPNVKVIDMSTALNGRRLCENTVGLLEEKGVASWTSAGAVDKTEWVAQIRTTSTVFGPYQIQESSHASYWGQLAMRNCLRQAYDGGAVRGGNRVRSASGLTSRGEPQMTLAP